MLRLLFLISAIFLITPFPAVSAEVNSSEFEQEGDIRMGIYVADLLSGDVLADARADELFVPASVMKAVTAASVMSLFGPYTRFSTRIYAAGTVDEKHILHGNLVVRAVGDPTMESSRFPDYSGITDSIAAGLRRAGIDSIAGNVTIDYSSMPESGIPEGWLATDRPYRYGAGHFPVNWHDNTFRLVMPDKTTTPIVPDLTVSFIKRRRGKLSFSFDPVKRSVKVTGRMPKKGASSTFALPEPATSMCLDIVAGLEKLGIGVGLKPLKTDDDQVLIYDHHSPTIYKILHSMMYWSDNLYAEAMLRIIAPTEPREVAAKREIALWKLKGADTDGIVVADGSGLSRNDRLTPLFLADVLEKMALGPRGLAYARLFPIAGRSGTVRRFLAGTHLEGRLALKSGTMSGVRCVAGYMMDHQGFPSHVVVVMTNSRSASSASLNRAMQEALLRIFAE